MMMIQIQIFNVWDIAREIKEFKDPIANSVTDNNKNLPSHNETTCDTF